MKVAMTVAAVAALMLIGTQGANADEKVTGAKCQDKFNDRSPARATCIHMEVRHAGGDKCRLKGECQTRYGTYDSTEITVRYDRLHRLNNCHGRLRDGSC